MPSAFYGFYYRQNYERQVIMKNKYCVYKHTAPNGKVYIGITGCNPEDRWRKGYGYHNQNPHFENAIKKYGWDNITHEVICNQLSRENACEMERFFIQLYKSYDKRYGYNKTLGGDSCAQTRERVIEQYSLDGKLLNKYSSLTEAARMSHCNISRISDCANGKRLSTNQFIWLFADDSDKKSKLKFKIQEKKHPSAMCGGANHQARPIEQYSLDGKYVATYSSAQEASEVLGIEYSSIKSAASQTKKQHKTSGGFIWIHADEQNKKEIIQSRMVKNVEKPISQYTLDGKHIRDFASITEAKSFLNTNGKIGECASGQRKTACGYVWKFA